MIAAATLPQHSALFWPLILFGSACMLISAVGLFRLWMTTEGVRSVTDYLKSVVGWHIKSGTGGQPGAVIETSGTDSSAVGAEVRVRHTPNANVTGVLVQSDGTAPGLVIRHGGAGTGLKIVVGGDE